MKEEGEREKRKKNEGSELSLPRRLLFIADTERAGARLRNRKSDRGWSLLTKYTAAGSVQSQC